MRFLSVLCLPLFLISCQEKETEATSESAPPRTVSYSQEVRPWLITNCQSCHQDLPLHEPDLINFLYRHKEPNGVSDSPIITQWLEQGSTVDQHWAAQPVREVSGSSVDDFLEKKHPALTSPRETPAPLFSANIREVLAGDLIDDGSQIASTGYLRKDDDTPAWRTEKVGREFLGLDLQCASCHDHPSEQWSTDRYQKLRDLFTTPYDHIPGALPPIHVQHPVGNIEKLETLQNKINQLREPSPMSEEDFLTWKKESGSQWQLPGLLAAFSFNDRQLTNLALKSKVIADGEDLLASAGAQGLAVKLDCTYCFIVL